MADAPELPQSSKTDRNVSLLGVQALNAIVAALQNILPSFGATATSATSGAATLPGNPAGFVEVNIGGQVKLLPFYNP